jgi:GDP-4-dehydro-6-deoxy-D-mannose reductase
VRALVTGGAGFAGRHLVAALTGAGHDVVAAGLPDPGSAASDTPAGFPAGAAWRTLDVTDAGACRAVLGAARPDWVFHLAGYSHVGRAEQAPDACLAANFGGTRALLDACLAAAPSARVLLVSSAEVYGRVPESALPVTEDLPLAPSTAYGVSKAAAEMAGHHARARGLAVLLLRPFNHIGPGQSPDFVASAFAQQIARIELGRQEPVLRVGNLEAVRDLSDVRDTVAGYVRAAEAGRPDGTYNVASGRGIAVRELLDTLLSLSAGGIRVEQDPARMRPLDLPVFRGSGERLTRDTGWRITRPLRDTLRDVLDYWRASERLAAERR